MLVHGAFAESPSWNGLIPILDKDGYPVLAVANPLRGVASDGAYVTNVLDSIKGPVVLVGHSHGGSVITEVARDHARVKALVYVSAFPPDAGETAAVLSAKFPGGTLGQANAPPVKLSTGGKDLYILQGKFHHQFAADVSEVEASLVAATQRPITDAALNKASGKPA